MKPFKFLFSMPFMGILLLTFATSIGVATFIEDIYGTPSAKAVVYNATWFEVLLGLMVINMIAVIFSHRLYRREKMSNFIFHVAFIVILIGAGITRYISDEGMMHIREGQTSNSFISERTYIQMDINSGDFSEHYEKPVLFSRLSNDRFGDIFDINGEQLLIEMKEYIALASQVLEEDEANGEPVLTLVIAGSSGRMNQYFRTGESKDIGGVIVSFNDRSDPNSIHLYNTGDSLAIASPASIARLSMTTQSSDTLEAGVSHTLVPLHLYTINGVSFVFQAYTSTGKIRLVSMPKSSEVSAYDAVRMKITKGSETKEAVLLGGKGYQGRPATVNLGGIEVTLSYGSKMVELPFGIALRDFQLERYPGSESPSSYASEVTLLDIEQNVQKPFRIYMNNILEHRGYRFYQSSFDKDELGTVLSVNHDYWGTLVTYIGYFFLALGLISVFFSKNTRFSQLSKLIDIVHEKRKALSTIILLFAFVGANAQDAGGHEHGSISAEHATKFGKLLYQSHDGRMAPVNTLANDLVRKVYKKSSYNGLTGDQVLLGMLMNPRAWQIEPMIKVKNDALQSQIGISSDYARFDDFFDEQGQYKLKGMVDQAFLKKGSARSVYDKEVIAVDERVNICYLTYQGAFMKIFPIPEDVDNTWIISLDYKSVPGEDSLFVKSVMNYYFQEVHKGLDSGDYKDADFALNGIKKYQATYGASILPSQFKVDMEIAYNNIFIFKRMFPVYMLLGFLLLVVLFTELLKPSLNVKWLVTTLKGLLILTMAIHTVGLISRWYISGHEPWSNGYESVIYIAWACMLAGLIFSKKSPMTLSATAILAGVLLFVAHLSWMDPEITNLVPVLKSYWLTIHVACITASYGFLGLGCLLSFLNLCIMIAKRTSNVERLDLTVRELSYVVEMTLTVGLVLLTIGNFLGGIWANESWGRYWGWDPKETWALATIIFYSFILHMRFIPKINGLYAFNLASVLGICSVIMTYFGVNFYLSGLHSYAAGDPIPIPPFVYYMIATVFVVGALAAYNQSRLKKVALA